MSGHSKWSTIKRKKAALDAKRGKVFTRLLREVTISARLGGGDPDANPRLRSAISDAKAQNVPNDNIDRAVKKGLGELEGGSLEEIVYEGYGPHGVAVLLETMTDNRNRTVGEVRHVFTKFGGSLGENGCVLWMFDQLGCFRLEPGALDEERLMELAVDLEVEDFAMGEDGVELYGPADRFAVIREELESRGLSIAEAALVRVPQTPAIVDESVVGQVRAFLEAVEDLDDVQNVWSNFDDGADSGEA